MSKAIQTADLDWQCVDGIDIPVSKQFGDVYFSKDNGLLETRHVFLNGNDLPIRLGHLKDFEYFHVAETGFGTGLNVLALWQLWQQVRPSNHSHLHISSIEKFPLTKHDLIRALNAWPELQTLAQQLIQQYPFAIAGCHRLSFPEERLTLDLWFGDVHDVLPSIHKTKPINAWFLDGFAPSYNPDIWEENVLNHIVRLSDIGTTFASFSVAGVLKRGLQQHGIRISRPKGFGHKNEMLKAIWQAPELNELSKIQQQNSDAIQQKIGLDATVQFKQRQIAIIGAGIAGLTCAWVFAQRGHQVTIYDQLAPLSGASGNPLALLNPKLNPIAQSAEHLMTLAWQHALRHYQKFSAFRSIAINQLVQKDVEETLSIAQQYPEHILRAQIAEELELKTEFPSLQLVQAGTISPHQLSEQILQHPLIEFKQMNVESIQTLENNQLTIYDEYQKQFGPFDHVMVCCALNNKKFFAKHSALKPIRGQVSWFNNQHHSLGFDQAYSYAGYYMQLDDQNLLLGASFYPDRNDDEVLMEDHAHNYDLMHSVFPEYARTLPPIKEWQGRASVRVQSLDYFPLVGKMQDDEEIYTFTALGSKGFLFAPICSEILVALALGEACPVPSGILQKLNPRRFQKKIKPKKPYYQKPM